MINIGNYINCVSSFNSPTGIVGWYDFSSGISGIIYNQIYSNVNNFLSGIPIASNYPLILLNGNTGINFTSNNCYILNNVTGNFEIILQFNPNICNYNTTGIDQILFSTIPNYSGINNGFLVGINNVNRIFVQNSNNYSVLNYELKPQDFIYLSLINQQYVNLGIYDILSQNLYSTELVLNNLLPLNNNLYIGNFLNNNNSNYTGYSGAINFGVLLNQQLNNSNLMNFCNCYFITGTNIIGTGTNSFQVPILNNYSTYVSTTTGITGYLYVSGNITNSTGGLIPIYQISRITGIISGNTFTTFSTGSIGVTLNENTIYNYIYNTGTYNPFLTYNISFYQPLMSGDYVEIYTYNFLNGKVGNKFDVNFDLPDTPFNVQILDNGLLQDSGLNFNLDIEGEVTGTFNVQTDIISYDLTSGQSIITSYSGWWARSKILMSGGSYFPSNSQYIESGSGIIITGINGLIIPNNTDLYLNGQKIISGIQYSIISSGSLNNIYILSGNYLPDFYCVPLYSSTGGLPTGISQIQSNSLVFYPKEDNPNYYLFNFTGSTNNLNNIIGFSPEIWINGIRQANNIDVNISQNCSLASGFINNSFLFTFFNNENSYFNI